MTFELTKICRWKFDVQNLCLTTDGVTIDADLFKSISDLTVSTEIKSSHLICRTCETVNLNKNVFLLNDKSNLN
jgi:hypothetical protein